MGGWGGKGIKKGKLKNKERERQGKQKLLIHRPLLIFGWIDLGRQSPDVSEMLYTYIGGGAAKIYARQTIQR